MTYCRERRATIVQLKDVICSQAISTFAEPTGNFVSARLQNRASIKKARLHADELLCFVRARQLVQLSNIHLPF